MKWGEEDICYKSSVTNVNNDNRIRRRRSQPDILLCSAGHSMKNSDLIQVYRLPSPHLCIVNKRYENEKENNSTGCHRDGRQ